MELSLFFLGMVHLNEVMFLVISILITIAFTKASNGGIFPNQEGGTTSLMLPAAAISWATLFILIISMIIVSTNHILPTIDLDKKTLKNFNNLTSNDISTVRTMNVNPEQITQLKKSKREHRTSDSSLETVLGIIFIIITLMALVIGILSIIAYINLNQISNTNTNLGDSVNLTLAAAIIAFVTTITSMIMTIMFYNIRRYKRKNLKTLNNVQVEGATLMRESVDELTPELGI